jgi:hypothetical protein
MFALIDGAGRVCEFFAQHPGAWPLPQRIVDVSGIEGIAENWMMDAEGRFTPPPSPAPSPAVPGVVALWQFRRELRARGWWDQVQATIAALPEDERADLEEWLEYGTEVQRQAPRLIALAQAMGVAEQLDDAFRTAGARSL